MTHAISFLESKLVSKQISNSANERAQWKTKSKVNSVQQVKKSAMRVNERAGKQMNERTDKKMNERPDKQMNERADK